MLLLIALAFLVAIFAILWLLAALRAGAHDDELSEKLLGDLPNAPRIRRDDSPELVDETYLRIMCERALRFDSPVHHHEESRS